MTPINTKLQKERVLFFMHTSAALLLDFAFPHSLLHICSPSLPPTQHIPQAKAQESHQPNKLTSHMSQTKWFPMLILQHQRSHRTKRNFGHFPEQLSDLLPKLQGWLTTFFSLNIIPTYSLSECWLSQALCWGLETVCSICVVFPNAKGRAWRHEVFFLEVMPTNTHTRVELPRLEMAEFRN